MRGKRKSKGRCCGNRGGMKGWRPKECAEPDGEEEVRRKRKVDGEDKIIGKWLEGLWAKEDEEGGRRGGGGNIKKGLWGRRGGRKRRMGGEGAMGTNKRETGGGERQRGRQVEERKMRKGANGRWGNVKKGLWGRKGGRRRRTGGEGAMGTNRKETGGGERQRERQREIERHKEKKERDMRWGLWGGMGRRQVVEREKERDKKRYKERKRERKKGRRTGGEGAVGRNGRETKRET